MGAQTFEKKPGFLDMSSTGGVGKATSSPMRSLSGPRSFSFVHTEMNCSTPLARMSFPAVAEKSSPLAGISFPAVGCGRGQPLAMISTSCPLARSSRSLRQRHGWRCHLPCLAWLPLHSCGTVLEDVVSRCQAWAVLSFGGSDRASGSQPRGGGSPL